MIAFNGGVNYNESTNLGMIILSIWTK